MGLSASPPGAAEYYRYCPGEEHNKISDAVCLGRRRMNFAKCKGCQFNDDERGQMPYEARVVSLRRPSAMAEETDKIDRVFKAYDVRATYPDPLDEDVAWRIGKGTTQFLLSMLGGYERTLSERTTLVVGRDMRKSSPALCEAFTQGALSNDTPVVDIGLIDTSQIYFATNHLPCCGGVQTTASHNPANYNGFKICGPRGKPIGADTGLKEIQRVARAVARHALHNAPRPTRLDLSKPYREYLHRFLLPLRPTRVVVDASNGMAGRWFPILFDGVENLTVARLNFEHQGEFNHPPNPLVPANLEQLRAAVREQGADFGACFDGDADRCIFVDERAEIVRCDILTALLAREYLREHPGATVVYDLRSSRSVPEVVARAGGVPRRERVGHVFMKRTMSEHQAVFGGELSGHFYFKDFFYCDSGMLAFIAVLNLLSRSGEPLSALVRPLETYASSGERNFENADKEGTFKRIADRFSDAEVDHLDGVTVQYPDWWFNVRASNTEPLVRLNMEAASAELLDVRLRELTPLLGTPAREH